MQSLNRYQNIRSAKLAGFSANSNSIYIKTRFSHVTQLHRVDTPGAARQQLSFPSEPIGEVVRQPNGKLLALTRD